MSGSVRAHSENPHLSSALEAGDPVPLYRLKQKIRIRVFAEMTQFGIAPSFCSPGLPSPTVYDSAVSRPAGVSFEVILHSAAPRNCGEESGQTFIYVVRYAVGKGRIRGADANASPMKLNNNH